MNVNNKDKAALLTLFFAALTVRLFAAHLDPFLHDWDERYHALVARNMMHDPFKPMLVARHFIPYDHKYWGGNHIWLHKQPLFLWQMALSMKLFGVSEFTMRYPSVLMGALSVLLIYRLAVLGTRNKKIGLMAALFACYSYLALDMTSGQKGIEHNDLAFQFYVLASMWAFAEYAQTKSIRWAVAVGLLSGCAVLNKWLPGLLVFAGWSLTILMDILQKRMQKKEFFHFLLAAAAAMVVFVPWQLYTLYRFPVEAQFELDYNAEHMRTAVEGHKGDGWFYYNLFPLYFGKYTWWLVIAGLASLSFLRQYHNRIIPALALNMIIAFVFFSFIVPTKMDGFLMIVAPLGYLFMAIAVFHIMTSTGAIDQLGTRVSFFISYDYHLKGVRQYVYLALLLILPQFILNLPELTEYYDPKNNHFSQNTRIKNNNKIRSLERILPKDVKLVINAADGHNIDIMFYNNNLTAYAWCLSREVFDQYIKSKNIKIAVFATHEPYAVPDYVKEYPNKYMITGVY